MSHAIESLAWHDATASKPPAYESVLLLVQSDAHGPVVWHGCCWAEDHWLDSDGGPIEPAVLRYAIPQGPRESGQ